MFNRAATAAEDEAPDTTAPPTEIQEVRINPKVELYNALRNGIHNFRATWNVTPVRAQIATDVWENLLDEVTEFAGIRLVPTKTLIDKDPCFRLQAEGFDPAKAEMPLMVRKRSALWESIAAALKVHYGTEGAKRDAETITDVVRQELERADEQRRQEDLS